MSVITKCDSNNYCVILIQIKMMGHSLINSKYESLLTLNYSCINIYVIDIYQYKSPLCDPNST